MTQWRTISISKPLFDEIQGIIKIQPQLGYTSVSDFVQDSVRRRKEELIQTTLNLDELLMVLEDIATKDKKLTERIKHIDPGIRLKHKQQFYRDMAKINKEVEDSKHNQKNRIIKRLKKDKTKVKNKK